MASTQAVAIKRANAVSRLVAATNRVAAALDLQSVTLPTQGHDPTLIHANQLETLAAWMESVADELVPAETDTVNYSDLTKAQLLAVASGMGLADVSDRNNKAAIIAAIEAKQAEKPSADDDSTDA